MEPAPRSLVKYLPFFVAALLSVMCYLQIGGHHTPDAAVIASESYGFKEWNTNFPHRAVGPGLVFDGLRLLVPDPSWRLPILVALQHLSVVLLSIIVWKTVVHEGARLAWWTALLFAVHPPRYIFAQATQTESFFLFLAFCGLAAFLVAFRRERGSWLCLIAGLLHGAAMVQRTVGVVLALSCLGVLLLSQFPFWRNLSKLSWRRSVSLGGLYTIGFILPLVGAVWKNHTHHGQATLIDGSGSHYYNRVAYAENAFAESPEWAQILALCHKEGFEEYLEVNAGYSVRNLLQRQGMTIREADDLLATAAKKTLLENPIRTVWFTARSIRDAASRVSPIGSEGALWMAGGIGEKHWKGHVSFLRQLIDEPSRTYLQSEFPIYRFGLLGPVGEQFLKGFFATDVLWIGMPGALLVLLVPLGGLVCRNPTITVFGLAGAGLASIAMLTEAPRVRFWYTAVPFLIVGFVVLLGVLIEKFRRRSHS